MKQFLQYGLTIILVLLQFTSIDASYCQDSNCCAFNGLTNATCEGAGTSDLIDLVGNLCKGDGQILVAGSQYGIYYVWGASLFWLKGAFANLFLNTLFAYVLEVPPTNYTKHEYYLIQVTGCPTITVLTSKSQGYLPTTTLSLPKLYEVVSRFYTSDTTCPGPCNLVPGSFEYKYPDFFNTLSIGQSSISLFLSSLVSFEYGSLYGCYEQDPLRVAKKNGLRVKKGSCPRSYVQADYPSGLSQECKNPNPLAIPEGVALTQQNFNFTVLSERGGLCALSVALGTLDAGTTSTSYLLTNTRVTLLCDSCKEYFIMNFFVQSNNAYISRQALWGLC